MNWKNFLIHANLLSFLSAPILCECEDDSVRAAYPIATRQQFDLRKQNTTERSGKAPAIPVTQEDLEKVQIGPIPIKPVTSTAPTASISIQKNTTRRDFAYILDRSNSNVLVREKTKKTGALPRKQDGRRRYNNRLAKMKPTLPFKKPTDGPIVKKYGVQPLKEGVEISSKSKVVRASMSGIVIYCGNQLTDYKTLVIVKHTNGFLTIYGHLCKVFVKSGQQLKTGQKIGTVKSKLYFEIRDKKKHLNPKKYLDF